ncbi:MAG: epimerase [Spirochaetes bacterium GWF1_41_5]|nr:MAG: epimerase [Spirochaetes bacterium GWF1_41_5]
MKTIDNERVLDDYISEPPGNLVDLMRTLSGDIAILGIAGKMGIQLGIMARRATEAAGIKRRIIGVSRFSDPAAREKLESGRIETISCDLLDEKEVAKLPVVENVVFMAGKKFGTDSNPDVTWVMNTIAPALAAKHFLSSRIVVYSTGCIYNFVSPASGGSTEDDEPKPVGDYAQSALGRERVFSYYSRTSGTPVCIVRLNYAIDLRYGVLHDIASKVYKKEAIDLSCGYVNVIWQGDAIAHSLLCLRHCAHPASVINIAGEEILSVREIALDFGKRFARPVTFSGVESPSAYLNNASRSHKLFGSPSVPVSTMMDWTAHWLTIGGRSLGKPTHFETKNGRY